MKKNVSLGMKKIRFLPLCLCLYWVSCQHKLYNVYPNHCGLYYKTAAKMHEQQDSLMSFYNFKPRQAIGSIGAQCANWEAMMASYTDGAHFYLEDIDTAYFKESQARFAWDYYGNLQGRPLSSSYELIVGNEKGTQLPNASCDKIFIINSFHEFSFKKEMLEDIAKKLKPGGLLYIDEIIAKYPGQKHGGCKKELFTEAELIGFCRANDFEYTAGMYVTYRKSVPYRKIYVYKRKQRG